MSEVSIIQLRTTVILVVGHLITLSESVGSVDRELSKFLKQTTSIEGLVEDTVLRNYLEDAVKFRIREELLQVASPVENWNQIKDCFQNLSKDLQLVVGKIQKNYEDCLYEYYPNKFEDCLPSSIETYDMLDEISNKIDFCIIDYGYVGKLN
ncbi:uncharacterized protein LOC129743670 [Uranotaenia lowii]|uniref:uncharacterized protein LOC129743670 n=1 Tax=Uranotaenia lowii TaxID=190385 RepID=UPI00247A3466|nr:uncharacterized protein LOC129743670 [Uranotaenia lowii]